jgi:hypothetical protein
MTLCFLTDMGSFQGVDYQCLFITCEEQSYLNASKNNDSYYMCVAKKRLLQMRNAINLVDLSRNASIIDRNAIIKNGTFLIKYC